jgi:DNA-binding MarR family transcriptional regulator
MQYGEYTAPKEDSKVSLFKKESNLYALTPKGKRKAEEIAGRTPEGQILCHLEDHGESSPGEIAEETNLSTKVIKHKLKKLHKLNYIATKAEE